jgi:NAD+ diphosphatase
VTGSAASASPEALAFCFAGSRLLVRREGNGIPEVPSLLSLDQEAAVGPLAIGSLDGRPCVVMAMDAAVPPGLVPLGLRDLFPLWPEPLMGMAVRASEVLEWYRAHAFCGRCGTATVIHATEMARACPGCGALHFARISPAVITLVHRGRELLLARNHSFRPGFFALVAGFVEPGETLEQAVAREVREEVGIEVRDLRYFGSQAWPFPSQLMVGFFACYASGEIRLQATEIAEARWFDRDRLPPPDDRPAPYSIAGRLIAAFLERG